MESLLRLFHQLLLLIDFLLPFTFCHSLPAVTDTGLSEEFWKNFNWKQIFLTSHCVSTAEFVSHELTFTVKFSNKNFSQMLHTRTACISVQLMPNKVQQNSNSPGRKQR
jgi:hypothetical protein